MLIGEVADQVGITVQSLRHYERLGLLEAPERRESGYREYPRTAVAEARFIRRARDLGFSLKEIKELVELRRAGGSVCETAFTLAQSKIQDIERKIENLSTMKASLESLVASCVPSSETKDCAALDELIAPGDSFEGEDDLVS